MIRPLVGNIFESEAQTLVNTVNCVGIMGQGLALEFKKLFPDMYEDYVVRCEAKEVRLGEPYLYRGLLPPWILNFPTKDHWRSVSRLSDIVAGLEYLEKHYREWEITSLAVRYGLPAICPFRFYAERGCLLSYGNEQIDNFRRAAQYADRILKGVKPSELPVQAPVKFVLTINLKTAKALGLELPVQLQQRADAVIE